VKTARKPRTAGPFKPLSSIPTRNLERILGRTGSAPAQLRIVPKLSRGTDVRNFGVCRCRRCDAASGLSNAPRLARAATYRAQCGKVLPQWVTGCRYVDDVTPPTSFHKLGKHETVTGVCRGCAPRVFMVSYQGRWALPRRELALHRSSPATKIEGPGSAWAFVPSGTDSAAQ
jgi:hypothetical protein